MDTLNAHNARQPAHADGADIWKYVLLISVSVAAIIIVLLLPPIPQDPAYNNFADQRTILHVPNFWDVISNAPFVIVGTAGLLFACKRVFRGTDRAVYLPYTIFFLGVFLTGIGSGYYHIAPTNESLVWDRLPMTIAFMSLLSAIISERVSRKLGLTLLLPLLLFGAGSVFYWDWTESIGVGDLRPYALVQFLPMIVIPLMLLIFPARYTRGRDFCYVFAFYVAAKLCEALDFRIFALGSVMSGHTLKHFCAAMGVYCLLRMLKKREFAVPPVKSHK